MSRPQLWVVAGPNGSGGTTLVTQRIAARAIDDEFVVINPDIIAQGFPLKSGHLDERRAGAAAVTKRIGLVAEGKSLAIETTLSGQSTLRFMKRCAAAGYKINLVYIGLDTAELSYERVRNRVLDGEHDVLVDAIVRRHPDSLAKLADAMRLADRTYVLDNSARRRRLLLILVEDEVRYLAPDLPVWFRNSIPSEMRRWTSRGRALPPEMSQEH